MNLLWDYGKSSGKGSQMTKVLCFDCGSMFTVPDRTDRPTKRCPECKENNERLS